MNTIYFLDIKQQIIKELTSKKFSEINNNEPEGVTLIDGFFTLPLSSEISATLILGGPTIPMVAILGNTTGRMYFFALKKLLPNLEL